MRLHVAVLGVLALSMTGCAAPLLAPMVLSGLGGLGTMAMMKNAQQQQAQQMQQMSSPMQMASGGGGMTELDALFQEDFAHLTLPDRVALQKGAQRRYPHASKDQVWQAAVIVLMQHGILIRSDRAQGLLAAAATPPLTALIEEDHQGAVMSLQTMEEVYRRVDRLSFAPVGIAPALKRELCDLIFDKVATQVYAEGRWAYLTGAPAH